MNNKHSKRKNTLEAFSSMCDCMCNACSSCKSACTPAEAYSMVIMNNYNITALNNNHFHSYSVYGPDFTGAR